MFKQLVLTAVIGLTSTVFSQYVIDENEVASLTGETYIEENHSEERLNELIVTLKSDSSFSEELTRDMIAYPAATLGYAWVDISIIPGARIFCEVVNLNNEVVIERRVNTDVHTVNLKDLPEGFYVIKIIRDGKYGLAYVHKGFEE